MFSSTWKTWAQAVCEDLLAMYSKFTDTVVLDRTVSLTVVHNLNSWRLGWDGGVVMGG